MSSENDLVELKLSWERKHFGDAGIPMKVLNEVLIFSAQERKQAEVIRDVLPESCNNTSCICPNMSSIRTCPF
jgi:hypothetical protein